MASTTFVNYQTVIDAGWLNDVNSAVYSGTFQASTITPTNVTSSGAISGATVAGTTSVTTPIVKSGTSLTLQTNGSTTAVTIDTAQNVGIGVTPSAWSSFSAIQLANGAYIGQYTPTASVYVGSNSYYNGSNFIYTITGYASRATQINGQHQFLIAPSGTSGANVPFTQAMTLDNSGNLLLGVSSGSGNGERINLTGNVANYFFRTYNTNSAPSGMTIVYSNAAPNNGSSNFLYMQDSGTLRATFFSNGGLGNYATNNVVYSDETLKKDITPAKSYLPIINQLEVVTYLFNDQTDNDLNLGLIAQQVQPIAPELVTTINYGTQENPVTKLGIYDSDLKYAMLKAIQELSAKVTALEAKVGV